MPKNKMMVVALLWFAGSLYFLLRPANPEEIPPFAHFDKFAHFSMFFGQFWLLCKAYTLELKAIPLKWLLVGAVAWAISSEFLQILLTTSRSADAWDALADVMGAGLALVLGLYVNQLKREIGRASDES
ncbi:MAG: VanZ family protein [Neisseriaceae bacterium]|nr:VanZ family protein [Neisseriaceae bacterium]MBP6860796.1 VanZ family protein [Neisseriaceae bacterium]